MADTAEVAALKALTTAVNNLTSSVKLNTTALGKETTAVTANTTAAGKTTTSNGTLLKGIQSLNDNVVALARSMASGVDGGGV